MTITINGTGTITGASTLATTVVSPTLTTPNINSAQFATVSGTAPIYPCRAWINFDGTSTVTIRASGNVTSVTDNGTGDYTVNFTTAMTDANYSIQLTAGFQDSTAADYNNMSKVVQVTASAVRFKTGFYAGFEDKTYCGVAIFR